MLQDIKFDTEQSATKMRIETFNIKVLFKKAFCLNVPFLFTVNEEEVSSVIRITAKCIINFHYLIFNNNLIFLPSGKQSARHNLSHSMYISSIVP